MSYRRTPLVAALALMGATATPPVSAQQVDDILGAALERYEQRMAGIENYIVTQDIMGYEVEGYYERREIDGRPVFVLARSYGIDSREEDDLAGLYHEFAKVANRADLRGQESVDGHDCYVLVVDDFSGVQLDAERKDFTPKKGTFYLDVDQYVLRRLVIEGDFEDENQERAVTVDAVFGDYREIGGMLHPFNTRVVLRGLTAQLSQEELAEARRSLEELRQQLESMPESQRDVMKSSLAPQMDKLDELVSSGNLEIMVVVKELRINEGPPERH